VVAITLIGTKFAGFQAPFIFSVMISVGRK